MKHLPDGVTLMDDVLIFSWFAGALSMCEDIDCSRTECSTIFWLVECACTVVPWVFPK